MRSILSLICILFLTLSIQAQSVMTQQDSLNDFYGRKNVISRDGMFVLGGWGAANLATGILGAVTTDGTAGYFFQMNALWGGVNVFIAYTATRTLRKTANEPHFLAYAEMDQRKTERLFLLNASLDVLYIGAGAGMISYSGSQDVNQERWEGYGQSFVLQGGFLLGFDLIMYYLHRRNKRLRLNPLLENLEFHGTGMRFRF